MLNAITQDITGLQLKDSFQVRLSLIGKIAEIGDWILDLQTNKAICSDYAAQLDAAGGMRLKILC